MQAPILEWPDYGVIEGRMVTMDRSASEAPRLTLDHVTMTRAAAVALHLPQRGYRPNDHSNKPRISGCAALVWQVAIRGGLVNPHQANKATLHLYLTFGQNAGFIGSVCCL